MAATRAGSLPAGLVNPNIRRRPEAVSLLMYTAKATRKSTTRRLDVPVRRAARLRTLWSSTPITTIASRRQRHQDVERVGQHSGVMGNRD